MGCTHISPLADKAHDQACCPSEWQEKENMKLAFQRLPPEMSHVSSAHISLAKTTHVIRPNFKEACECNLTSCPNKGNWNNDLYALHTSEVIEDQMQQDMKLLLKTANPKQQRVPLLMNAIPLRVFKTFATLRLYNLTLIMQAQMFLIFRRCFLGFY